MYSKDEAAKSAITTKEQLIKEAMEANLFSNVFLSYVLQDKGSCLHIVRTLMNMPELEIIDYRIQKDIPQLISKDVRLDIWAVDKNGKYYEIEIQKSDEKDPARRMRFYAAVMDSEALRKGVKYPELPEAYLFYLTTNDIWKAKKTVVKVAQYLEGTDIAYDNGLHTIYVNAEVQDGSTIAGMMQYLKTATYGDMSQGELSQYVNDLKCGIKNGGRENMCEFDRLMEQYAEERAREAVAKAVAEAAEAKHKDSLETARGLFADGVSIEIIAKNTKLPLEEVKALCAN